MATNTTNTKAKAARTLPKNPLLDLVLGYPRIAGRMTLKPETAIFRTFSALNARNLLYMQADLCRLELSLLEQEKVDHASSAGNRHKFATNYGWLHLSALEKEGANQIDLVYEIQGKLQKYSESQSPAHRSRWLTQ